MHQIPFQFTGSKYQKIFNEGGALSKMPVTSVAKDFLTSAHGNIILDAGTRGLAIAMLPAGLAVDATLGLANGLWQLGKTPFNGIISGTRKGLGAVLGVSKDTAETGLAIGVGGIQDVAIGAPLMATKNAFNATMSAKDLALDGVKSTALSAIEAPGVAFGAVADVVNGTRNALGLNKMWNFTLGRLPGLKVAEQAKTDRTMNWVKERWGRFGELTKDTSTDILKIGTSVADSYVNWGSRVANSGIAGKIINAGGGASGNNAPVSNFLFPGSAPTEAT